jgi:hypothetical protein
LVFCPDLFQKGKDGIEAQGHPLPEHSKTKSASALSRFLNINPWPSPAQLGLKLVKNLPKALTYYFQVMILADTAFGSVEFL